MIRILVHAAAIVALWPFYSFALFLGLQVDPLFGNFGIALTVVPVAAYVDFGWLR